MLGYLKISTRVYLSDIEVRIWSKPQLVSSIFGSVKVSLEKINHIPSKFHLSLSKPKEQIPDMTEVISITVKGLDATRIPIL